MEILRGLPTKLPATAPVAGFDLEDTLLPHTKKRSGPWTNPEFVWEVLRLFQATYRIVVITNRQPEGPFRVEEALAFLEESKKQGVALDILACFHPRFCKPLVSNWETYWLHCPGPPPSDIPGTFFCGDAAGRPDDHNASDLLFARNLGIAFRTPEMAFGFDQSHLYKPPNWIGPYEYMMRAGINLQLPAPDAFEEANVIVICGAPTSGKTTLATLISIMRGYTVLSTDPEEDHKVTWTPKDCLDMALRLESVRDDAERPEGTPPKTKMILDSTARATETRNSWRIFSQTLGYKYLTIWVTTTRWVCDHFRAQRLAYGGRDIPDEAGDIYWSKFEPPEADEPHILCNPVFGGIGLVTRLTMQFLPEFRNLGPPLRAAIRPTHRDSGWPFIDLQEAVLSLKEGSSQAKLAARAAEDLEPRPVDSDEEGD